MSSSSIGLRNAVFCLLAVLLIGGMMLYGQRASLGAGAEKAPPKPASPPPPSESPAPAPSEPRQLGEKLSAAEKMAEAALSEGEKSKPTEAKPATTTTTLPNPTFWELFQRGGVLMYPITLLSVIVVCFGLERFIGLRRSRVLPRGLVKGLRKAAAQHEGLDPRTAYALCQKSSSVAAVVIKAMLRSTGRPDAEVRQAVTEASEREATRLYFRVRWLNMAMNVAPMLGLLGTVQGMIIVFMGASHLPPGANKSEHMATGIYLKLVCTFAGLIVAIPAAILSHYFEARIQGLMGDVEDLVAELLPRMRRFEQHRRRQDSASSTSDQPVSE